MKINVANLVARLQSGNPTAEDMEQASQLAKSLAAGEVTPESVDGLAELRKAMGGECDDEDEEGEEAEEEPVRKAVEVTPAPAPAQSMEQQMQQSPDTARAINAVPSLMALVKGFDSIMEAVSGLQTEVAALRTENATLQKSMDAIKVAPQVAPPAAIPAQVGNDTAEALVKALQATGLVDRLEQLETDVNRRAYSGNPARRTAADAVQNGGGARGPLRKDQAITIIQKSLQLNRMTQDEAGNALAQLDLADSAIRRGEVSYGLDQVVRQFDPQTLKEFAGF